MIPIPKKTPIGMVAMEVIVKGEDWGIRNSSIERIAILGQETQAWCIWA